MQLVAVTEVLDEAEAGALLGSLRAKGIAYWCRRSDVAAGAWTGWMCTGGPIEVLVREDDLEAARALLPARVS
jgi:Putative prokaryotic signal transducing protein